MSLEQNLKDAVIEWRKGVKSARAEAGEAKAENPYGQQIYELNKSWGEAKKAHDAKIAAAQEEYKSTLADLLAKSAEWKSEYGYTPRQGEARGRPKNPDYSDEVKIAAAMLYRKSGARTIVRLLLGTSDTLTLNRVLTEGEALLKAREGADW